MDEITDILATEYGTAYEIMSSPENDKIKGDDEVVTLPVLKSKTWTNSKDKFIFKLQGVKGKCNNGCTIKGDYQGYKN